MPSSPSPQPAVRTPQRFFYRGICLKPQDALPDGKHAYALNIRGHEDGTWEPRYGQTLLTAAAVAGGAIHSIFRLNDPTTFAPATARWIVGSGTSLYTAVPGTAVTFGVADTGYSGNPFSMVAASPYQSSRPYAYIGDSSRMRKIDSGATDYPIGLAQPTAPPTAILAQPQTTLLNAINNGTWVGYGGQTTPAGTAPTVSRIDTTITSIIHDDGTTGMASFAVVDYTGITPGTLVFIGPASTSEETIIQEVLPPVAPTTIAAIIYDSGNTGLCTIQPTGSFSAGQIELPDPVQLKRRFETQDAENPVPLPVTVTRTVDFPVNALILLGGIEIVRIESIAIGPDGVQSFRCTTTGTHTAGEAITGMGTLRAYGATTWLSGDRVATDAVEVTLTPTNTTDMFVGGVQSAILAGSTNWALVGNRAVQPEDIIRFGIKVSLLGYVQSVRLTLDLQPPGDATVTFLKDYYFYEWRAADLVTAIQATTEVATGLVKDSQKTAVAQGTYDTLYNSQYGAAPNNASTVAPTNDVGFVQNLANQTVEKAKAELAKLAPVQVGGAISRQLALGNNAWMTLECRVGDLIRVGTDNTLTLGAIKNAGIWLQSLGTTDPIVIDVADAYITGGYGPDVAMTLPPYVYGYSYRSTLTGERSNLSPPMRAGMLPHRNRVTVSATPSADPQCDSIDFWRFGGSLAKWAYVGTIKNDATASPPVNDFNDDYADSRINGGPTPLTDHFQPWPTIDLPRTGTCTFSGTAVQWVSGDTFNTSWAPGTPIIINGITTQLYQSPQSTTFLQVTDNVGSGTALPFFIPEPTLLSQSLPGLWGGPIGNAWFNFACGDPNDPGALHWTHANDPDATSDAFELIVTAASEPLQNGYFDNGVPYVASSDDIYRIVPTPGGVSAFLTQKTNCGRGFWTRWCFCVDDTNGGVYFLAKDGIYFFSGGGIAKNLTFDDLAPLFPQEGTVPEAIRSLYPVDMTATTKLKLTMVDQVVYFDYQDTQGALRTLVFEPQFNRWTPDAYAVGLTARYSSPGLQVHEHLMGGTDGNLREYDANALTDATVDIQWALWTPWANGDDVRGYKQWGDAILDFNPGGSQDGISVTPVVDNGDVAMTTQLVGTGGTVRDTYVIEVGTGGQVGYGVISRNFGLEIQGAVQVCDTQRPLFYLWEPCFYQKGASGQQRTTDWDDLGYKGAKFVQGVVIRANTFGLDKQIAVQYDGPNAAPTTALTLTINHNGEQTKTYPLAAAGWAPFIAELVRLKGADNVEWLLLDWRFVWEPAPELATQYETQYTTFDFPGFFAIYDGVIAHQSTADLTWRIEYQDGFVETHTIANSGGNYQRIRQICNANKGKAVRFRWTSTAPFRLFKRDLTVRAQPWGVPNGYVFQTPFGGPSRVDGAEI